MKKNKRTYSNEQVLKSCLIYFKGDELAANTWMSKYAMKDASGKFLEKTPDDMHRRMAKEFSRIEKKYKLKAESRKALSRYGRNRKSLTEEKIYEYFAHFKFVIPQGSVMSSLGNPYIIASLSNCVVLPEVKDSYGGILYTDQQLAQLFKRRCGAGIDISGLRPAGLSVSNAAITTSGAVSFMERFSNTTREVAQHGRRGALMITMDVRHPDIAQFVTIKQDLRKVTGANISVKLSDEFMKAVTGNQNFALQFPVDSFKPQIRIKIKAGELWDTIIASAHNTAEPGLIFWDRQHLYSTSSVYPAYKNSSTNPCSEIAMQGGDSCRLIAINLFSFISDPFTPKAKFDFEKFYEVVYESQRLMDDLVDLELEAIDKILNKIAKDPEEDYIKDVERRTWQLLRDTGKKGRRTGLGFTALADALAGLHFAFDSDASLRIIEKIMQCKCRAEFESSIDMAIERGKFEDFNQRHEGKSEFVQMLRKEFPEVYKRMMKYGRRNISISTVAPTGTLSILAQSSSGIEPVFMLSYTRRRKVNALDPFVKSDFTDALGDAWQEYSVQHPKLKKWMEVNDETDFRKSPYYGSTAAEIDWKRRIEIQALVQKYTTHSISSTINLPKEADEKLVGEIYMYAWKKGLKGITVYREGSRTGVLIAEDAEPLLIAEHKAPKRPKELRCDIVRFSNKHEKWVAVVGLLNERPYEIFTGKNENPALLPDYVETGKVIKVTLPGNETRYDLQFINKEGRSETIEGLSNCFDPEYWNYAKLLSGVLRHGMPLLNVVHLIEDLKLYDESINTWKKGVERALRKYIPDGTSADKKCPNCGDPLGLIYEEGCLKCSNCGYSKC